MKARAAWPLLAQKAEDAVNATMVELVASRKRIEHLQTNRVRMLNIYEDYKQRAAQAQIKRKLLKAEQHLMRMQSLVERDLEAIRKHNRVQDQKQMDALGLTLFNLRS